MNNSAFQLHPRLHADTVECYQAPLCHIALMNDARFPWLILIPRKESLREWTDLPMADQMQLQSEINACAKALQDLFPLGEKLNIAALGNIVEQLHIHVVLRHENDAAWPKPVWGFESANEYTEQAKRQLVISLQECFLNLFN